MKSLNVNNETVHSNSSNQPGSAENSHSLSVQYETVARRQQYESIADTGYEQIIAQYEAVHNNTLEHVDEQATQGNQLEGQTTADRWVNNVDEDGHWLIPNDEQSVPSDGEGYLQVLNDDDFALCEQSGICNRQVRLESYGYLQPVAYDDTEVHAQPTISLNSIDITAASSDTSNQLNPLSTAQDDTY
jgi:hypothetical protein